jgi:uncharacterized protein
MMKQVPKMLKKFNPREIINDYAQVSIRNPKKVLISWGILLFMMATFVAIYPQIKLDPGFKNMIMSNDRDRSFNTETKNTFGDDEFIVVAVENPKGIFNKNTLQLIRQISESVLDVNGVREVYSITNISNIRGRNDVLDMSDLITTLPDDEKGFNKVINDLNNNPSYLNNVISANKKVAGINIELDAEYLDESARGTVVKDVFKAIQSAINNNKDKEAIYFAKNKHGSQETEIFSVWNTVNFVLAQFNDELNPDGLQDSTKQIIIENIFEPLQLQTNEIRENVYATGFPVASYLGGIYMLLDMAKFVMICSLLIIAFMWLIFRNTIGIISTMFVAMIGVVSTYGLMSFLGIKVSMPLSALMVFVMALGMEYSLYVTYAYIEATLKEYEKDKVIRDKKQILSDAMWNVRGPVLLSSLTTCIGFLSMWLNPVPELAKMGALLAFGTMTVSIAALTVIPAIFTLKDFPVNPERPPNPLLGKVISGISASTEKRPRFHLAIMGMVMGFAVMGWTMLSHDTDAMQYFKKDADISVAERFVRSELGGTTYLQAVIKASEIDAFKKPENLKKLEQVQIFAEENPAISRTISHVDNIKLINRAMNDGNESFYSIPESEALIKQYLLLVTDPEDFRWMIDDDYQTANILLRLNTMSAAKLKATEKEIETYMGRVFSDYETNLVGTNLLVHRAFDEMATSMISSLGMALVAIFIVLLVVFRSFKLACLALIANFIPVALIYAILGWIGHPLDPPAAITGAISLGIAVDDTIHFFKNWRRHMDLNGQDSALAVQNTLKEIGKPMILSTLAVAFGFGVMLFSQYGTLVWMAIMLCVASLSALLSDLLLTPALLRLTNGDVLSQPTKADRSIIEEALASEDSSFSPMITDLDLYTDEQVASMKAYDLFALTGMNVIRHAGAKGTRRLLYELDIKPGMKVLELGSGKGDVSIYTAKKYGAEVTGIDISPYMIEISKQKAHIHDVTDICNFTKACGLKLAQDDNSFDIVIMESFAMYVDVDQLMSEVYRVLKPKGRLGFTDWVWTIDPSAELDNLFCQVGCNCNIGDVKFYSQDGWNNKLETAGLDINQSELTPFEFFSLKRMIDDEGGWRLVKIFARIFSRKAIAAKLVSIMSHLTRFDGWTKVIFIIAEKPETEKSNLPSPTYYKKSA